MTTVSYDDLVAAATIGLSHRPLHVTGLAGAAAEHAGVLDFGDQAAALLGDWAAALAQDPWLTEWPVLLAGTPAPGGTWSTRPGRLCR